MGSQKSQTWLSEQTTTNRQRKINGFYFQSSKLSRRIWPYHQIATLFFSFLKEGNGTPLQSSCLENPMDGGAWWAAVHGVAKSQTRLSDFTSLTSYFIIGEGNGNPFQYSCLENPTDRGAWQAMVHGVAKGWTQLKWVSSSSNVYVSMLFSQITPPSPPTGSESLFFMSVSPLLPCT